MLQIKGSSQCQSLGLRQCQHAKSCFLSELMHSPQFAHLIPLMQLASIMEHLTPLEEHFLGGILVEAERFLGDQYPFSIELDPNKGNFHLRKKLFMQQTPFRLLIYYWRCNILQDWVDSTMGYKGEDCRITHGSWIWLKYWTSFCRTRSIESDSTTSSLAAFEFAYQPSWLLARVGIYQNLFNYRWEDLSAKYKRASTLE